MNRKGGMKDGLKVKTLENVSTWVQFLGLLQTSSVTLSKLLCPPLSSVKWGCSQKLFIIKHTLTELILHLMSLSSLSDIWSFF